MNPTPKLITRSLGGESSRRNPSLDAGVMIAADETLTHWVHGYVYSGFKDLEVFMEA